MTVEILVTDMLNISSRFTINAGCAEYTRYDLDNTTRDTSCVPGDGVPFLPVQFTQCPWVRGLPALPHSSSRAGNWDFLLSTGESTLRELSWARGGRLLGDNILLLTRASVLLVV